MYYDNSSGKEVVSILPVAAMLAFQRYYCLFCCACDYTSGEKAEVYVPK